jgi:hypothetical protein
MTYSRNFAVAVFFIVLGMIFGGLSLKNPSSLTASVADSAVFAEPRETYGIVPNENETGDREIFIEKVRTAYKKETPAVLPVTVTERSPVVVTPIDIVSETIIGSSTAGEDISYGDISL